MVERESFRDGTVASSKKGFQVKIPVWALLGSSVSQRLNRCNQMKDKWKTYWEVALAVKWTQAEAKVSADCGDRSSTVDSVAEFTFGKSKWEEAT